MILYIVDPLSWKSTNDIAKRDQRPLGAELSWSQHKTEITASASVNEELITKFAIPVINQLGCAELTANFLDEAKATRKTFFPK